MTDIKNLWQGQKMEKTPMTLADIHAMARKFQTRTRRALLRETVATAIVIVAFGYYIWAFPGWMIKLGSAVTVAWALWFLWQLRRRARARALPPEGEQIVAFHRRELARRRDLLRNMWRWQLLPLLPGMVLILLGRVMQFHAPGRPIAFDHLVIALGGIIVALILAICLMWQRMRAHALQRRIDDLDALGLE
jgi:hypothetical protein